MDTLRLKYRFIRLMNDIVMEIKHCLSTHYFFCEYST